jgi:hypothetical protein
VNEKVRTILNCSLNQSILSRYLSTMEGAQLVIVNSVNVWASRSGNDVGPTTEDRFPSDRLRPERRKVCFLLREHGLVFHRGQTLGIARNGQSKK